jgi:hypothetical protein
MTLVNVNLFRKKSRTRWLHETIRKMRRSVAAEWP